MVADDNNIKGMVPEKIAKVLSRTVKKTENEEERQQFLSLSSGAQLIEYTLEGAQIHQRPKDGYINATELCRKAGKVWLDYQQTASTKIFLDELASVLEIPEADLIQYINIENSELQDIWVHPRVAVNLANWLSPKFDVFVSGIVEDWITGRVKGRMPYHVERYMMNHGRIPHTHFSMLQEIYLEFVAPLEDGGIILPSEMMPDISTGRMFSNFMRDKGIDPENFPKYKHHFPDGRSVEARLYPIEYLPEFRQWFNEDWIPHRSVGYFQERLPKAVPLVRQIIATRLEHKSKKG